MSVTRLPTTPYEQHRGYVLGVLGQRCSWLDVGDREAAFHDAYVTMLEKERARELDTQAMHSKQVRAYLTLAAVRRAFDEGKRVGRKRGVPLDDAALGHPDPGASPEDRVAAQMDSVPVREIVAELPERRQVIVKLRFYFDRTPEEIQRFLEISERVYRRELERAMRQIAERYDVVRTGQWCERRRSLVLAYVAGIAGPRRMREARSHIAACPACAHLASEMHRASRHVAAALPVPALGVDERLLARLAELAVTVRDGLADAAAGAKQQALQLAVRADPSSATYAAGVRPGAAAAAVAGCIAAAGGATYCVVAEVPKPIRSLVVNESKDRPRRERRADRGDGERRRRATSAQAAGQATPTTRATPTPTPARTRPRPAPTARPERRRRTDRSTPRQEFGFEAIAPGTSAPQRSSRPSGGSTPSPSAPPTRSAPPRTPRRSAPRGAPGVFEVKP